MLVLSTVIARTGIIGDPTATVIGAMIVAPLAVPIQGAAVAIAYGELRPLLLSLAVVVGSAWAAEYGEHLLGVGRRRRADPAAPRHGAAWDPGRGERIAGRRTAIGEVTD